LYHSFINNLLFKDLHSYYYLLKKIKVSIQKILIIQTAFIGDVILASGLIEKIKQYYPQAQIDFLCRKGNETLLQHHPSIHKLLIWDKHHQKYSNLLKLIPVVRQSKYDVVVNLQRFAAMGLLTALSGAKQTLGFTKNPFSLFFTRAFAHTLSENMHETARNHQLIRHLTDDTPAKPALYPSQKEYEATAMLIHTPYICIAPTSVWHTKQFPEEKWISFLRMIPEHYRIYLLGAPSDTDACQRILEGCGRANLINLAGKLSLLASAALMQKAVMNYVNDSAPMHLASAMNAPTCAVYCSTVPAFGFGPLSERSFIVEIDYPLYCRPCGLHGYNACPEKHFKCAYDIEVKRLADILNKITAGKD
jgi:heptosyltransferase-2